MLSLWFLLRSSFKWVSTAPPWILSSTSSTCGVFVCLLLRSVRVYSIFMFQYLAFAVLVSLVISYDTSVLSCSRHWEKKLMCYICFYKDAYLETTDASAAYVAIWNISSLITGIRKDVALVAWVSRIGTELQWPLATILKSVLACFHCCRYPK